MVSRENPGRPNSRICEMFTYVEPVVFRANVMVFAAYLATAPPLLDRCPEDRDGRGRYLLVGLRGPLQKMLRRNELSTELLEPCVADVCLGLWALCPDGRSQPARPPGGIGPGPAS